MHRPLLEVTHSPNPCNQYVSPLIFQAPYPFMWYYRTELRNNTDAPLRVISFEGYSHLNGEWMPNNVMRRPLGEDDFWNWYGVLEQPGLRVIPPHGVAVCEVNWHGNSVPWTPRIKWNYKACDEYGNVHETEAEIVSCMIFNSAAVYWYLRHAAVAAFALFILYRLIQGGTPLQ